MEKSKVVNLLIDKTKNNSLVWKYLEASNDSNDPNEYFETSNEFLKIIAFTNYSTSTLSLDIYLLENDILYLSIPDIENYELYRSILEQIEKNEALDLKNRLEEIIKLL